MSAFNVAFYFIVCGWAKLRVEHTINVWEEKGHVHGKRMWAQNTFLHCNTARNACTGSRVSKTLGSFSENFKLFLWNLLLSAGSCRTFAVNYRKYIVQDRVGDGGRGKGNNWLHIYSKYSLIFSLSPSLAQTELECVVFSSLENRLLELCALRCVATSKLAWLIELSFQVVVCGVHKTREIK